MSSDQFKEYADSVFKDPDTKHDIDIWKPISRVASEKNYTLPGLDKASRDEANAKIKPAVTEKPKASAAGPKAATKSPASTLSDHFKLKERSNDDLDKLYNEAKLTDAVGLLSAIDEERARRKTTKAKPTAAEPKDKASTVKTSTSKPKRANLYDDIGSEIEIGPPKTGPIKKGDYVKVSPEAGTKLDARARVIRTGTTKKDGKYYVVVDAQDGGINTGFRKVKAEHVEHFDEVKWSESSTGKAWNELQEARSDYNYVETNVSGPDRKKQLAEASEAVKKAESKYEATKTRSRDSSSAAATDTKAAGSTATKSPASALSDHFKLKERSNDDLDKLYNEAKLTDAVGLLSAIDEERARRKTTKAKPAAASPGASASEPKTSSDSGSGSFVAGKQKSLGKINTGAKKGDPEHTTPKKTFADGTTPAAGMRVTDESGNTGEVVETYQAYSKIKMSDGKYRTINNKKLNRFYESEDLYGS